MTSDRYVSKQAIREAVKGRETEVLDPAVYGRLAALKRKYDPNNLFRMNQNIVPSK